MSPSAGNPLNLAIIGAGLVSDYHHVPGIRLDPRARVAAVCDTDEALLEKRKTDWDVEKVTTDPGEIFSDPGIDAVIIATPNFTHPSLAIDAARSGKHIMCEKPLGLNATEVAGMYEAAKTAGVVHMTAFTYRFAPSMRYLKHLVENGDLGQPRHFRSQRFLDLPETSWGWRQYRDKGGAGDLFDMTIHRIDFAQDLLGPISRICGSVANFAPRTETADGSPCAPSEVDDWSAIIGDFESGATGVWEGTTLVGFIDWEQAYPAPPLLDLADAAWKTTPLCPDEELTKLGFPKPPDRAERLAVLARGYGLSDPRAVLDNVRVLQEREHRRIIELGQAGREPWRTFLEGGLAERTVRDQRWLESNYTALLSA